MTKIRKMIELLPPYLGRGGSRLEKFTSSGHRCPYCSGNGYFWSRDETGEAVKDPCPVCEGSGCVKAEIEIRWSPDSSDSNAKDRL